MIGIVPLADAKIRTINAETALLAMIRMYRVNQRLAPTWCYRTISAEINFHPSWVLCGAQIIGQNGWKVGVFCTFETVSSCVDV